MVERGVEVPREFVLRAVLDHVVDDDEAAPMLRLPDEEEVSERSFDRVLSAVVCRLVVRDHEVRGRGVDEALDVAVVVLAPGAVGVPPGLAHSVDRYEVVGLRAAAPDVVAGRLAKEIAVGVQHERPLAGLAVGAAGVPHFTTILTSSGESNPVRITT